MTQEELEEAAYNAAYDIVKAHWGDDSDKHGLEAAMVEETKQMILTHFQEFVKVTE